MNKVITDLRNIISNKLKYQKIIFDIQIDQNISPGFADFIPKLLTSNNKLNLWYQNIIYKSNQKTYFRNKIIENKFREEISEIKKLKNEASMNSYYNSQFNFAKPFLEQNSLEINDLTQDIIDRKILDANEKKLKLIEDLKNRSLNKNEIFNKIEPILIEINQMKACKKINKIRNNIIIDDNIEKKIQYKKYLLLKKINKLKLYNGSEMGIGFERLGFDILKKFAKQLGPEYHVGEILANNIWNIKENKKKGMKQDLDGFIFKIEDGIIKVHEIYEFKSSHLAIVEDISKLERLIDYLLLFNYNVYFELSEDGIFRPVNNDFSNNDVLIMNKKSFCFDKFKINRYQNIKYLFKLDEEMNRIRFNYITISQFNKTKNINDIENKKKKLINFLKNNKKSIANINKIGINGGLIGVLIKE
jgi:hypothetical protein